MEELIIKSTKWVVYYQAHKKWTNLSLSPQSGRAYCQVHQMDELIVRSTRWTSLLSSPQNGQFITKSTKSGRIYLQVHQIDELISMSTRWTNLSLEVHKVDEPITKKWMSLKKKRDRSTTK